MQSGNGCGQFLNLRNALRVPYAVLRHGARPMENAIESRLPADASQILQLGVDGANIRLVFAAQETACQGCALRRAVRKLRAHPCACYDPPPLFPGDEEPEAGHRGRAVIT